jgi:hypothetical protein
MAPRTLLVALLVWSPTLALAQARGGQVSLPLDAYRKLLSSSARRAPIPDAPLRVAWRRRTVKGTLQRDGLLVATYQGRFTVLGTRDALIPLLDNRAAVTRVLLDGRAVTLRAIGNRHGLRATPGDHRVQLQLAYRRADRFARKLHLRLASGGPTRLRLSLPEAPLRVSVRHGTLVASNAKRDRTEIEAQLDGRGELKLRWSRVLHRAGASKARLSARGHTLFSLGEALVRGVTVLRVEVQEGEVDQLRLRLPQNLELLAVEGAPVLQWQELAPSSSRSGPRRVVVFLKHLLRRSFELRLRFQQPTSVSRALKLAVPTLERGPTRGTLGVQAPTGLQIAIKATRSATRLALRELPTALTSLTRSPLSAGFRFDKPPELTLQTKRLASVKVTSTLIDALSAVTVVLADGSERSKLRLRLRNNARQYLRVWLPADAKLDAALLDGEPLQPARGPTDDRAGQALLFPLRQSERVGPKGRRYHRVRPDETLGDIAHRYFSDPSRWRRLLLANPSLRSARDLRVGQRLVVPSVGPVAVEESSFTLELSYRRAGLGALGLLGRNALALPRFDVDTLRVVWHLYLPDHLTPLRWSANLTRRTARRDGPLRRALRYLRRALRVRSAWAGGGYTSILAQRKGIFRQQAASRSRARATPGSFPLVGRRYRFKRVLGIRAATPQISVSYLHRSLLGGIHAATLFLSAMLACWFAARRRRLRLALPLLMMALVPTLIAAHHVPGMHRRLLWGLALGLLAALLWPRRRALFERLRGLCWSPWSVVSLLRPRALLAAFGVTALLWLGLRLPLLLSTFTCAAALCMLVLERRRETRAALDDDRDDDHDNDRDDDHDGELEAEVPHA